MASPGPRSTCRLCEHRPGRVAPGTTAQNRAKAPGHRGTSLRGGREHSTRSANEAKAPRGTHGVQLGSPDKVLGQSGKVLASPAVKPRLEQAEGVGEAVEGVSWACCSLLQVARPRRRRLVWRCLYHSTDRYRQLRHLLRDGQRHCSLSLRSLSAHQDPLRSISNSEML